MANKTLREKWLDNISAFCAGKEPTCPNCKGHNFKDGYLTSKSNPIYGWGAIWCEDCRNAFVISRMVFTNEKVKNKIVDSLPSDLKFVG